MAGGLTFGIRINADGAQASQELRRVTAALSGTNAEIVASRQAAAQSAQAIGGMTGAVRQYAAAFAGALSARGLIRLADSWGQISSRIEIAAGSSAAAADAQERLMEVSNRTYKSFGNSAELYVRTSQSLRELGYSADSALGMVEALQYGLTVSAANSERSANVIGAWSKAVNQGKMGMEEYLGVLNGAPRLIQALADSLGKSTVELQAMVRDGKLTADVLIGVASQVRKLGDETDRMPVTLADAFQRAENSLMKFAGSAEANTGIIKGLTVGIAALSNNIDLVAAAAGTVAVAAMGKFAGSAVSGARAMVAQRAATQQAAIAAAQLELAQARAAVATAAATANSAALAAARAREAAATTALAAAQRGSSLASAAAGSAIAALGGPVGLLITALGAAAIAWSAYSSRAEQAAQKSAASMREIEYQRKRLAGMTQQQIEQEEDIGRRRAALAAAEAALEKTRVGIAARRARGRDSAGDEDYYRKALEERQKAVALARESLSNQSELNANGGTGADAAANARYATYINERRSLSERMKADLATEADAFAAATKTLRKGSAEYAAAMEAYNLKVDEIQAQYQKKEPKAPRPRRQKEPVDYGLELNRNVAQQYASAMQALADAERSAEAASLGLTNTQQTLRNVMLSPAWKDMPQPWRDLIQAQADAAASAEATAAYQRAMDGMAASLADAAKSTMGLDAAQSALFDLMLSPAWAQMTESERQAAAWRMESSSAALKEIELEQALQAARANTATAAGARMQSQLDYVDRQVTSGRFSEQEGGEIKAEIQKNSSFTQQSFASSIARGLVSGFSSGGDIIGSLAQTLQSSLLNSSMKGLEDGISKALDVAGSWISELFSGMGSGSGGWGGIISAIGSWFASARGNAFASAGPVRAFAAGGAFGQGEVLTRPTFFRFASGGAWRGGVAGEAGPEAALPLKRMPDGRLGVYAEGGGRDGVNVSIVVNADGGGRNEAQSGSEAGGYAAFARRIEAVVRGVITAEQRPGGMLARA